MSSPLSDVDIETLLRYLSNERMTGFLATSMDRRAALEMHQHSTYVATCLMPVIGLIEIALRNAICEKLDQAFGSEDWLENPPPPFTWQTSESNAVSRARGSAQRAAYAKLSSAEKRSLDQLAFRNGLVPQDISHEKHARMRQMHIMVSRGQIVAQLTLFFWKRLFSAEYEQQLWKRCLKKLFPNKTLHRPQIADHLEILYVARNRIAHHEPIIEGRLLKVLTAIDFIENNFERRHLSDAPTALSKFLRPHRLRLDESCAALNDFLTMQKHQGQLFTPPPHPVRGPAPGPNG